MAKLIIQETLKKKKLSKRQLAKRLGIDYSNVFRMFRPGYDPKFSTLVQVAEAIGVKLKDLFEDS